MTSSDQPDRHLQPAGRNGIFDAVTAGDADAVRAILDADPVQVHAIDKWDWSVLGWASKLGHLPIVRLLLENGADSSAVTMPCRTPALVTATIHGYTEIVALLLDQGADIRKKYQRGETLLHVAAYFGGPTLVKMLLARNADPNARDDSGLTPLMKATQANNRDSARILVDAGARLDVFSAVALGLSDAVDEMLTAAPALARARMNEYFGWTPLHYAARRAHVGMARLLLSRNADVNGEDNARLTPLHWATTEGSIEVIELLLAAGANPNAAADNGRTPLHWAARGGQVGVVKCLLENGADATAEDEAGKIPVDEATEEGHAEVIELLVPHSKRT